MSTTIKYNNNVITTLHNQKKVLETSGTWVADDIEITDASAGGIYQDENGYLVLSDDGDAWKRPSDWPDYSKIDISDEECIFFTYDSSAKTGDDWMAIYASCTGGYTVELGTLTNGIWTVEETHTVNSGAVYGEYLPIDRDYTVYKVRPTASGNHITSISMRTPVEYNGFTAGGSNDDVYLQKCIERYGNLPYVTRFGQGSAYSLWGNYYLIAETQLSTTSVTNFQGMYQNCYHLQYVNTNNCNTSKVTNMASMFQRCYSLKRLDANHWNTSNVTDMNNMFNDANRLEIINCDCWNTGKVTNMSAMFLGCFVLKQINPSAWDISKVTNVSSMFNACRNLQTIDVSKWNTSSITNMSSMFSTCSALQNIDISKWDTSNVTNMYNMFAHCYNIQSIGNVSNWDTSAVTNMEALFNNCYNLLTVNISNWDVSKVTNFKIMFQYCKSLQNIDVSNWDTSAATAMNSMFNMCLMLQNIEFASIAKVYTYQFNNCSRVKDFIFNVSSVPVLDNTNAFSNNNFANGQRIRFPASLVDTAKAATNWSTYAQYIEAIQT